MLESVREIHGHASRLQFMCKQTTDQSQLSNRARNCRRIEIVSIQQISCTTLQKLSNLRSQTGNFVAQQN